MELKIEVNNLEISTQHNRLIHDCTFSLPSSSILNIIGESGSGKSLSVKALCSVLPEAFNYSGIIKFNGVELSKQKLELLRGKKLSMIFQESSGALNPLMTLEKQITELLVYHRICPRDKIENHIVELLNKSGLHRKYGKKYPHELSGGMKQRGQIAIALASNPEVLICDEPTTALDPQTSAQLLDEFEGLANSGYSLIFITHDFGNVIRLGGFLSVMYAGYTVENGLVADIKKSPSHPYTKALLDSRPEFSKPLYSIPGDMPGSDEITGCPFYSRCDKRQVLCSTQIPSWSVSGSSRVRCHFPL
ncbi:ABC transporter ATP-binding protein [Myxococcota bacterium]|nr:ABC transporter ATP-binding protein [Myxococcota bacterium]MBU1382503.1 ABC transporter ATP-binding protein [Myxococcota bacterium]MBU1497577.1 ABC transporter ATP-binding protein [Myxococcota bacterium]